ncbi:sugar kinase [Aliiroseovarius sp. M344]|uniref:PfkB family carbohydrate kinase n=1 Tax=Aliiroseovarius sp. M344 TaxID=2867010 RepID=UPI0021AD5DA5|nr:PfkB family carbohydrate kinase [Aliiroseovarius sp. M344]UWQ15370.1 sugar kinase [Aliiroseovarius sp. M344]
MTRILCVGAAVVDFVFHLDELPDRAEKYGTDRAVVVGGGCAANAAVAVTRLGGDAILGARLGTDSVGDMVLAELRDEGVDVDNVTRTKGARSSFSSVLIDMNGERLIVNFRGEGLVLKTAWFAGIGELGAVLTDTRRVDAARDALSLAKTRGIPGVLDGEAPIDPTLLDVASHAALSMQGLRDLHPDLTTEEALKQIASDHGCWVCATDGANDVWFTDGQRIEHVPAYQIEPVDTLGAGDVWHGAFALSLAQQAPERAAIEYANAAAAVKCLKHGGRAGAPTRTQIDDFLKERRDDNA